MLNLTDNIIELNRDVEPAVIQGCRGRSEKFKDKYKALQFVHFADVHAVLDAWNRIVEYINYYSDYISFAIHAGDYVGGNQDICVDFYNYGTTCKRPILNCVGNHDTYITSKWIFTDKDKPHKLLFSNKGAWGASFMDVDYSMSYYKDFPEENIRLIVLNLYYDIEQQKEWLKELLDHSLNDGVHVVTVMHEWSDNVTEYVDTVFNSIEQHCTIDGVMKKTPFEDIIREFITKGGNYVCNLCGHMHHDVMGYTDGGVLNIGVECATDWDYHCDSRRVRGTRTFDCFNVMAIDANLGLLKITRVGNNIDSYFRTKKTMCFDYVNKKIIN